NFKWFLHNRRELVERCVNTIEREGKKTYLLSLMDKCQLQRVLTRVWDPDEFRSEFGLRSMSKYHEQHPFRFGENEVCYEPGNTSECLKGGNSNWRGPIWFPTSFMLIESARKL